MMGQSQIIGTHDSFIVIANAESLPYPIISLSKSESSSLAILVILFVATLVAFFVALIVTTAESESEWRQGDRELLRAHSETFLSEITSRKIFRAAAGSTCRTRSKRKRLGESSTAVLVPAKRNCEKQQGGMVEGKSGVICPADKWNTYLEAGKCVRHSDSSTFVMQHPMSPRNSRITSLCVDNTILISLFRNSTRNPFRTYGVSTWREHSN